MVAQITDEEYQKFYKALSKDYDDSLLWTHFKAEGDVEFRCGAQQNAMDRPP